MNRDKGAGAGFGLLACCLVLLCITAQAQAKTKTMEQWAESFGISTDAAYDGTRIIETREGSFSFTERRSPGKQAIEMAVGGMQGTMILREDLDVAWFVMRDMGVYREIAIGDAQKQQAGDLRLRSVKEVGREVVNGFSARKFEARFKDADGKGSGWLWITDAGVPIKMDMVYSNRRKKGERMLSELRDLQMRPQSDAYFELPAGIQSMNLSAMMQMAGQMQSQSSGPERAPAQPSPRADAEPGLVDEVGKAAKDEAERTAIDETRSAIREGIRGLFKR